MIDYTARALSGSLAVPTVAALASDKIPGDKTLQILLDYYKSFFNAYFSTRWASIAPEFPTPITNTFAHDPTRVEFSEFDLPALYLWRTELTDAERIAEDWQMMTWELSGLWIMPPALQQNEVPRSAYWHALPKAIFQATQRLHDPAYVNPSDPNPNATKFGSNIAELTSLHSLSLLSSKIEQVEIEMDSVHRGQDTKRHYDCVSFKMLLIERDKWLDDGYDTGYGVSDTITAGSYTVIGVIP